jgi:hypothetical protein
MEEDYKDEAPQGMMSSRPGCSEQPPIAFARRSQMHSLATEISGVILNKTEKHERHLFFSMLHDMIDGF